MRTSQEINEMIERLIRLRDSVPEYSFFGDNNWAIINAQIDVLRSKDYNKYANDPYEVESAAYEANEWLHDLDYPDLVSEEEE